MKATIQRLTFVMIGIIVVLTQSSCSTLHQTPRSDTKPHPHYATVKNGKIEYYTLGHGSPIILIPGYSVDVSSWDKPFLATLASQHELIIVNNRGVGGSVIHSTHYQANDLANDDWQLIQALRLQKPTVLGISMGGMISQELAILHPKEIGHLVLINTAIAGKQAVHPSKYVEEQMNKMPTYKITRLTSALELFFPLNESPEVTYELLANRFIPADYKEADTTAIMPTQMNLVMHWAANNRAAQRIATLPMPTLILNGEADLVIPPVNSEILANTIPHATLKRWKNGGHGMLFQYPVATADAINHFLAS